MKLLRDTLPRVDEIGSGAYLTKCLTEARPNGRAFSIPNILINNRSIKIGRFYYLDFFSSIFLVSVGEPIFLDIRINLSLFFFSFVFAPFYITMCPNNRLLFLSVVFKENLDKPVIKYRETPSIKTRIDFSFCCHTY